MKRSSASLAATILSAVLGAFALCADVVYLIADHNIDLRVDWEKFQQSFNALWLYIYLSSFCAALLAAMTFDRKLQRPKVALYVLAIASAALASSIGNGSFYFIFPFIFISLFPYFLFLLFGFFFRIKHARYKALTYSTALILAHVFFSLPSMQASTRSPVSRVKNDMRSIATALEAYFVDYNGYPPSTTDPSKRLPFATINTLPNFQRYVLGGSESLTTPVSFLTELPGDPLSEYRRRRGSVHEISTFAYWAPPGENGWILLSPGPDYAFDIDFSTLKRIYRPKETNPTADLLLLTYDATNGSYSRGDLWRVKQ